MNIWNCARWYDKMDRHKKADDSQDRNLDGLIRSLNTNEFRKGTLEKLNKTLDDTDLGRDDLEKIINVLNTTNYLTNYLRWIDNIEIRQRDGSDSLADATNDTTEIKDLLLKALQLKDLCEAVLVDPLFKKLDNLEKDMERDPSIDFVTKFCELLKSGALSLNFDDTQNSAEVPKESENEELSKKVKDVEQKISEMASIMEEAVELKKRNGTDEEPKDHTEILEKKEKLDGKIREIADEAIEIGGEIKKADTTGTRTASRVPRISEDIRPVGLRRQQEDSKK